MGIANCSVTCGITQIIMGKFVGCACLYLMIFISYCNICMSCPMKECGM